MKTRKSCLLGSVVVFSMLVVCSSGYAGSEEWAEVTKKLPKRYAGTTLQVLSELGPWGYAYSEASKEFMEATGIKLFFTHLSPMEHYEKMMLDFMVHGGAYDVNYFSSCWKAEIAPYAADLNELANQVPDAPPLELDDYVQRALEVYGIQEGKLVGFPALGDVTFMLWNKNFYQEVGLDPDIGPSTWDEVYNRGKLLMKPPERYGFGMPAGKGSQAACIWILLFKAFGGEYFDTNMKPLVDSEPGIKAMKFMAQELKEISPPGITTWDFPEMWTGFATLRTAQTMMWPGGLAAMSDPEKSQVAGHFGWGPVPTVSLLGGWGVHVNVDSKNKEAAYLYLAWLSSPEMAKKTALMGGVIPRISTLTDPDVINQNPYFPALLEAITNSVWFPNLKEWPDLDIITFNEINATVAGTKTPEQGAHDLQEKWFDVMEKYGYYE